MKFLTISFFFSYFIHLSAVAEPINDKIIATSTIPQGAYNKISTLANLAKIADKNRGDPVFETIVYVIEMELVNNIAILSFVIEKYPNDSTYSKYVLDKIVFGFRNGYFNQIENLKSEQLLISIYDESVVNMKKIYENVKIDPAHEKEFKTSFERAYGK